MWEDSLWLIIGRFQPFHHGHKLLIERSLDENLITRVLIGSSETLNDKNPYSYTLRKEIIRSEIWEHIVWSTFPLPDFPNDEDWKNRVLQYIPENISTVQLYCGDLLQDSAVAALQKLRDSLPFTLRIIEIPRSIIPISATQIRAYIQNKDIKNIKKCIGENTYTILQREENLDN